MCSLDYLSNKIALNDNFHKTQFSLLEMRKQYEKLLKNHAIENEKRISTDDEKPITNEQAKLRNQSIFDNLQALEIKINRSLNIKISKLLDLKNKYEASIIESSPNTPNISLGSHNIDETDYIVKTLNKSNNKPLESKIPHIIDKDSQLQNSPLKADNLQSPPSIKSNNDHNASIPRNSLNRQEITNANYKPIESEAPENKANIYSPKKSKIPTFGSNLSPKKYQTDSKSNSKEHPIISPRVRDSRVRMHSPISPRKSQQSSDFSGNELDSTDPPIISPHVRDSRERTQSPIPPRKSTKFSDFSNTFHDSNNDGESGKYFNDTENFVDKSNENFTLNQYLKIFEAIHDKFKEVGNYRPDYIEGVNKTEISKKESFSGIENLLKSEYITLRAFSNVKLLDIVAFMIHWLPKMCIEINLDASNLNHASFKQLFERKSQVDFEELNSKITKTLCSTNETKKLWNQLNEHFDKLIQDRFLSCRDISDIFSSLLMPFSSTDSNEHEVSQILEWLLSLIEAKYKPEYIKQESVPDIPVFSDDDSTTMSSIVQTQNNNQPKTVANYHDVKQLVNQNDHLLNDDDPNDEIETLLVKSFTRSDEVKDNQKNQTKNKLINSIKGIDDDFVSQYQFQGKNESEKPKQENDDNDDDFDFYK